MKTPKDDIFRLIQSMTPAEKRYFRQHGPSGGVMMDLFDFLNGLPEYEEERVKQQFPEISRNFKVYKQQLQQLLLDSLANQHRRQSVASRIRIGLEEVEILVAKQQNNLAGRILDRLRRLCEKHEEYSYLLEISRMEFLVYHTSFDKAGVGQNPLFDQIDSYIAHLTRQNENRRLSNELIDLHGQVRLAGLKPEQEHYLRDLLLKPELDPDLPSHSFLVRYGANIARGLIFKMLGQREKEKAARKANVDLFSRYPAFQESIPYHFLGAIRNYLNFCMEVESYDEALPLIEQSLQLIAERNLSRKHEVPIRYLRLGIAYRQGDFVWIDRTCSQTLIDLVDKSGVENDRIGLLIFLQLGWSHLFARQYQKVPPLIYRIRKAEQILEPSLRTLVFFLEWLNHFESGEEWLAHRLLSQQWKRTAESEGEDVFKDEFFPFLQNLLQQPLSRAALATGFLNRLETFPNTGVLFGFRYFQLSNWLKSLVLKKPVAELFKQQCDELKRKGP